MDELPQDWWHLAENEAGGHQYRTVNVQVLDKKVETMLDGCAGANHITEVLMGMLNRAAELGIGTNDRRFPVVRLEKWVHPEFARDSFGPLSLLREPLSLG